MFYLYSAIHYPQHTQTQQGGAASCNPTPMIQKCLSPFWHRLLVCQQQRYSSPRMTTKIVFVMTNCCWRHHYTSIFSLTNRAFSGSPFVTSSTGVQHFRAGKGIILIHPHVFS
uniref:Uncharacterized protein n=1 Tax=Arundo donax TaxID=35708 RepID=A0A0A9GCU4_ARUDO